MKTKRTTMAVKAIKTICFIVFINFKDYIYIYIYLTKFSFGRKDGDRQAASSSSRVPFSQKHFHICFTKIPLIKKIVTSGMILTFNLEDRALPENLHMQKKLLFKQVLRYFPGCSSRKTN